MNFNVNNFTSILNWCMSSRREVFIIILELLQRKTLIETKNRTVKCLKRDYSTVRSMKNVAVLTEDRAFALFFRPHFQEFAIQDKKNANARGSARTGAGHSWNWLMHGQHSLTSFERPSHLRSDFVNQSINQKRYARLVAYTYLWLMYASASIVYSDLPDDLMFVSRSCPAFSIIPRLIQRRCHCLRLKDVLKFQASSYSAG